MKWIKAQSPGSAVGDKGQNNTGQLCRQWCQGMTGKENGGKWGRKCWGWQDSEDTLDTGPHFSDIRWKVVRRQWRFVCKEVTCSLMFSFHKLYWGQIIIKMKRPRLFYWVLRVWMTKCSRLLEGTWVPVNSEVIWEYCKASARRWVRGQVTMA